MRILLNNIIPFSTITSLNESQNYPASNLQDQFLHQRYQSALDTDLVTLVFEEGENISCLFYAFTNASELIFRFYLDYETLVYTITVDDPLSIDALYFDMLYDITYMTIEITGDGIGVFLGGVATGLEYSDWPDPKGDWTEPDVDNSTPASSPDGQSLQNYVRPLTGYIFTFIDNTRELMSDLKAIYRNIGIGLPLWIDPFQDNHNFLPPMYGKFMRFAMLPKIGRRYDFEIELLEAR